MPLRLAAWLRGCPPSTIAMANRRRPCAPSLHFAEANRKSAAVNSCRVTLTGAPIFNPCRESIPHHRVRVHVVWKDHPGESDSSGVGITDVFDGNSPHIITLTTVFWCHLLSISATSE